MIKTKNWFVEADPYSPINYRYAVDRVLYEHKSAIQEIKVLEHQFFGRMLVLDDVVQLTERDEFYYHEMLAHVPMHSHPAPRKVLVIGGGDGGTLREALKHPSVGSATLVDIDPEVIEVSKRFFPAVASGFADPRAVSSPGDGAAFLRETREKFDIILVDAPDPVGPAQSLHTQEFFKSAQAALTENGVFAMQTESLHFHIEFVQDVQKALKAVFSWVSLYAVPLATYAGNWWTFSIAAKAPLSKHPIRALVPGTLYYGGETHPQAYVPARVLNNLIERHRTFGKEQA